MKFYLLPLIIAAIIPTYSMAETFHHEGREADISWRVERKILKLTGEIKGGSNCKQLNAAFIFYNSKNGSYFSRIDATIEDYRGRGWNRFWAEDPLFSDQHKQTWTLQRIDMSCLQ